MSQLYYRTRAQCRWSEASGLAAWAVAQMDVRYQQSVVIRQGEPAEEAPVNAEPEPGLFVCDLILADQAAAQDAAATLSDPTVLGEALPLDYEGENEDIEVPSWVDVVECDHAFDYREGSVLIERHFGPVQSTEPEPWVQPEGSHDAYMEGDEVTHNGSTWVSTIDNNTYGPGVYGWDEVAA